MTAAEIILRIGASLGSLLILGAHTLTIRALTSADCRALSDGNLTGTAIFACATVISLAFAGLALPWLRHARGLAGLALLLAAVLIGSIGPALARTSLAGEPLCIALELEPGEPRVAAIESPASGFERAWPLLQAGVALIAALQAIRYLRTPRSAQPSPRP